MKHILRELYSKGLNWKGSMFPMPTLSQLGSVGGDGCFVYLGCDQTIHKGLKPLRTSESFQRRLSVHSI
jgi:hypothetical protein